MNMKECLTWFATCPAKAFRHNAGFFPIRQFLRESLNLIRYGFDLAMACALAAAAPIAGPLLWCYLKATEKRRAERREERKRRMADDI